MDPKLDGVAVYIYWLLVSDYLPIEITVLVPIFFTSPEHTSRDCLLIRTAVSRQNSYAFQSAEITRLWAWLHVVEPEGLITPEFHRK